MLDELKEEVVIKKVGGRFKLSTLIQKRLVQLNAGSRPLVDDQPGEHRISVVLREIMEDKIYLDSSQEIRITGEAPESDAPLIDFDNL